LPHGIVNRLDRAGQLDPVQALGHRRMRDRDTDGSRGFAQRGHRRQQARAGPAGVGKAGAAFAAAVVMPSLIRPARVTVTPNLSPGKAKALLD
jgi:hypothetical protein